MDEPTIDHFEGITRNRRLLERLDADVTVPLEGCRPFAGPLLLRGPVRDISVFQYLTDNRGIWEPHLTRWITGFLRSGGDFVDAGANLGYFSVLGGAVLGNAGNVYGFEPIPAHFSYCEQNVILNNLDNVKLLPYALWNKKTKMRMTFHGDDLNHMGGAHVVDRPQGDVIKTGEVQCVTFDELVDSREVVLTDWRFMKMDIEGAEPFALDGMRRSLGHHRPAITLELNTYALGLLDLDESAIWDRLKDLDYRIMAMMSDGQQDAFSMLAVPLPNSRLREFKSLDQLREVTESLNKLAPPCFPIDLVAFPREKEIPVV